VWEPPRRIAVAHKGLVSGTGEFRLDPVAGGVVVTWAEQLDFPWQFGGLLGAALTRPLFRWIWKGNLKRLRTLLTQT